MSWLLIGSVAVLLVPVSLQIFSRYTALIPSYIWTEELARFLFVWMIMIGAMLGIREGTHFEVDVWPTSLSRRRRALVDLFVGVAVLVFAVAFLWWGISFTRFAWNRFSELAELPLWLIHVAWPIAGATWLLFQGERMVVSVRTLLGLDAAGEPPHGAHERAAEVGR
ncbi:MAG: TRAP transporter small permease [Rubrivivax sp.]|nr:TRAP transporter small permease [Rubrivivax sp.]